MKTRKSTALADLDIEQEGLAQQDGLAERLARQRARPPGEASAAPSPQPPDEVRRDPNAWRRGKALVQVAIPEDIHVELSIVAKRRRLTMSKLVKEAVNDWLQARGYTLRLPD